MEAQKNKKKARTREEMKALRRELAKVGTVFLHNSGSMGRIENVELTSEGPELTTVYASESGPRTHKSHARMLSIHVTSLATAAEYEEALRKSKRAQHERAAALEAKRALTPKAAHPSASLGARVQELEHTVANLQAAVASIANELRGVMSLLDAKTAPAPQPTTTPNALKVIR